MYDTILHPTDGSDGSEAALSEVERLATLCDATVHVLHVVDTAHGAIGIAGDPQQDSPGMVGSQSGGGGMGGERGRSEKLREEHQQEADQLVERIGTDLEAAGIETETAVSTGDPQEAIRQYATETDVDVIVMGTHGRTGLDRYLIGSVTEKVVRSADVPVLTVQS